MYITKIVLICDHRSLIQVLVQQYICCKVFWNSFVGIIYCPLQSLKQSNDKRVHWISFTVHQSLRDKGKEWTNRTEGNVNKHVQYRHRLSMGIGKYVIEQNQFQFFHLLHLICISVLQTFHKPQYITVHSKEMIIF